MILMLGHNPRLGGRAAATSLSLLLILYTSLLPSTAVAQQKLLFGYQIQSDVSDYLNLANTIHDIRHANSTTTGLSIYGDSSSSISLATLSLDAWERWHNVPLYNTYVAAFTYLGQSHEGDAEGEFDRHPAPQYADTLVRDLFQLGRPDTALQATAAVALTVVMTYWGTLWDVVLECQMLSDSGTMLQSLDAAVALWIGAGQERNENQMGYLLYNMAEQAGARFGQDEGETIVNTQFLELVLGLKHDLTKGQCVNEEGYALVRAKVQSLIQYTNVVLMQMLLHHIQDVVDNGASSDFVEVFSLSLLPQIYGCDSGVFDTLLENTVNNDMVAAKRDATIQALQRSYSCLGISCAQVGSYEYGLIEQCTEKPLVLAGLETTSDVKDVAFVDRDVRQMRMAMELGNWIAAADYYVHGWNADMTLRQMATNAYPWTTSDDFSMYESFYANDPTGYGFSDTLVQSALQGTDHFTTVSETDRASVIVGTIQSSVLFLGIIGKVDAALAGCDVSSKDRALLNWDGAAALIIGSTEGSELEGQAGGQSLFSLSKQFCKEFGTCDAEISVVDKVLVASWRAGTASLVVMACEEVEYILTDQVLPNLLIPLLQGLLYYTVQAATGDGTDGSKGYLLAYTQAILPYVQNPEDARMLRTNSDQFRGTSSEINVAAAFRALKNVVAPLQLECARVGQMRIDGALFGVCSDDNEPPVVPFSPGPQATTITRPPLFLSAPAPAPVLFPVHDSTRVPVVVGIAPPTSRPVQPRVPTIASGGKDLAWGRFQFTNIPVAVQDSRFTLDVRDMYFKQDPKEAWNVYSQPSKNAVHGLSEYTGIKSLQHFSTRALLIMEQDPVYNFFRVALFDDETFDANATGVDNGWPYADAVEDLAIGIENGNSAQLGSKVVVVMEIWMMIAHKLYESARRCGNARNSPELIDSAVALWIGQEQGEGKYRSGWSMYAAAQEAIELYGVTEEEAKVNSVLMDLFVQAQSLTAKCSSDKTVSSALNILVDEIVRNLSIPLLQHLLFYMAEDSYEYVELFALSLIPQAIGFDEGGYEFLRDALFEGFSWDSTVNTQFLETFGKFLQAMRFTCDDFGDTTNANDNLRGLVSVLCDEVSITFDTTILAGYQTSTDVSEVARIDLDIHQIDLFMRANAFDLALQVYKQGRNSRRSSSELRSLADLATQDGVNAAGKQYEDVGDFFLTDTYSDRVVMQAIADPDGSRFAGSSRRQRSEAVRRALQTMVVYLQVVAKLRSGVASCNGGGPESPSELVDEAVALFVGSMEGPFSGGSVGHSGQSLYAIGKEFCALFKTCESHGDADANVKIQFAFSNMKEAFDDGKCNAAESTLEDSVLPMLLVPLVQGTLYYAHANDGAKSLSPSKNLTAGDLFAESLLPQVAKVNETAAAVVFENMDFEFGEPAVRSGKGAVFDAFSAVVRGLGLDCATIGVLEPIGRGLCREGGSKGSTYVPTTPVSLGENLYMSTTYIQDRANIAIDVKEIEESLRLGHVWSAKTIYMEGRNSAIFDSQGKEIDLRTLKQFSTNAGNTMARNALYQITVHALSDDRGMYMGKSAALYADSVVKDLLDKAESSKSAVAAEAVVALNLWMELVNELHQTVQNCREGKLTDEDGIHSIDEAVAYWIGDGQIAGNGEQGHLLYALAERMGRLFNINTSGQSRTNTNVLRLFQEAKMEVSVPGACSSEGSVTAQRVRRTVDKLTSQMLAVHIQALVRALLEDTDREQVRVYAHVVVPLISVCNTTDFEFLRHMLLNSNYKQVDIGVIIRSLRSSLACFGLRCDDMGFHPLEDVTTCEDKPRTRLTEYKPTSDVVEAAKLDLDIAELELLLEQGALAAAEELYSFGKHASLTAADRTALSLESLATSAGRTVVPQLDSYRRFYSNNDRYADTIIREAISTDLSSEQRKAMVVTTSQVMIVYMGVLEFGYDASAQCKSSSGGDKQNSASIRWDRAAALLIGSLEGSREEGSTGGRFLWALSKELCGEFGTCSKQTPGSSHTNDKIASLLYAGRGAALDGNCDELKKVARELSLVLRVPLFQAAISSAVRLSRTSLRDRDTTRAEAHVYAQALLPLIADANRRTADMIQRNFPMQGQTLKDGLRPVLDAYLNVMHELEIDCEDVGASSDVDACQGVAAPKDHLLMIMSIATCIILVAGILTLVRVMRTRNKPENSPTFVRSQKGEMNHLSDLIPKRNSEERKEDTDWTEELTNACAPILSKDKDDDAYIQAIEDALSHTESQDDTSEAPKVV